MTKRLFLCLTAWLAGDVAAAATYYVDCRQGSDATAGTSAETPWRSTVKVSATTFAPGDAILFRRGTQCAGMLQPKGSGESGRPIRIGSYGEGARPVIDGTGQPAALRLFNQSGWAIENIETAGGNPYGIHIGGDAGALRHFRLRDVVVHDVTGDVKTKASGLVVVHATGSAALADVVVDGVVAHHTTQWAGVLVQGASRENRARDVTVRNTVVHDVYGDGIVLFQVEDGLIEKSAAWLTGLQPTQTIGTPNGIWTWRCRRCTVRHTEGFFIDSPGVDAGVYDIDWGCDDNVVEHNYGHDAQGYCASVFGAQKEVTTNSVVRYNVCVNNGRSPRLARRQGDFYISTWDGGALDGVRVHNNTFYWNPPLDAPAVQMDHADFTGRRENRFYDNVIVSEVPAMIHSSAALRFEGNVYWYAGGAAPRWEYGGAARAEPVGGRLADPRLDVLLRPAAGSPAGETIGALPAAASPVPQPQPGRWTLKVYPGAGAKDARSQLVFLEAALAQYDPSWLEAVVAAEVEWPLERVRLSPAEPARPGVLLALVSPSSEVAREWRQLAHPAELGLVLRHVLGPPRGGPSVTP